MTALPHGPAESPPALERLFPARGPLVLGFLGLAALAGGLLGWGAFASISGAVIAAGRVEVETRDQVVEHIDGGTVSEILVRDGDAVAAGDVLIRLDDGLLRTEEALLNAQYAELAARRNRLEAEFRNLDRIVWDADVAALAETDATVREILDGQRRLFKARAAARAVEAARLRERIDQTREQITGLEAQGAAVTRQSGLIARELAAQRTLFEKGLTRLDRVLALERAEAQLEGQAGDIVARIAGARERIAEIEIAILQIGTRRMEEAETKARDAHAGENQVRERLASVRARLGRMVVRAPVAGEVFGMSVFGLREVVRPGEPILHIVPAGAGLTVMARLDPIHVDQVWPGQQAVLKFSAFPARTTPEFEGRVVRVSANAMHDAQSGLSWYEVEIAPGGAIEPETEFDLAAWLPTGPDGWWPETWNPAKWLGDILSGPSGDARSREEPDERPQEEQAAGTPPTAPVDGGGADADRFASLALTPGMPVEVHMRTGERSPLSYLVKPLTDYFARSLGEE